MQGKPYHVFVVAILGLLTQYALASTEEELERGLMNAMRLNKETGREGDSGKAIQAYMRDGFLNRRPDRRAEYTDYYLLKKPARFMRHELVMIEEEYMLEFIGCCANAGVGVTLRVNGSTENVEEFADANGCRVEENVDLQEKIAAVGIKAKVVKGNYLSLSCRERDAAR